MEKVDCEDRKGEEICCIGMEKVGVFERDEERERDGGKSNEERAKKELKETVRSDARRHKIVSHIRIPDYLKSAFSEFIASRLLH